MGALEIRDPRAPHGKSYLGYHKVYRTFCTYTLYASRLNHTGASRSVEENGFAHLANFRPPQILCAAEFCLETNEIDDNSSLAI